VTLDGFERVAKAFGPNNYHFMKLRHFAFSGQTAEARAHAESLVVRLVPSLREYGDRQMLRRPMPTILAEAYSYLGRPSDAARESDRAVAEARLSHTARDLPSTLASAAYVDVQIGRRNAAVAKLEEALRLPLHGGDISRAVLRSDPSWAPLRGNLRFEALLASGRSKAMRPGVRHRRPRTAVTIFRGAVGDGTPWLGLNGRVGRASRLSATRPHRRRSPHGALAPLTAPRF
jgi:tetratricopeptide (TPR) repeat protein